MLNETELKECRETVQSIIDNHLPEDKRFSVENFSQEALYYISSFLLEKDEEKKKEIWENFQNEMTEINKKEQIKLREGYLDVVAKKQEYDTIMNSFSGLDDLLDGMGTDQELKQQLTEI